MYQNNIYNEDSILSDPFRTRNPHTDNPQTPPALTPHLASEHFRSRHSISLGLVSIIRDAGICSLVRSREPDQSRRDLSSTAGDLQLMASWVELRARV